MMTRVRRTLLAVAVLGFATPIAPARASLYTDLGGKEKITGFVNDFVDRLTQDKRIQKYFVHANLPHLKYELGEQFCTLSGGPCQYTGRSMTAAHEGMHLNDDDFNALVEDLQNAMDAASIPFATQNRLLALLAPMHVQVVDR